ncbi:type II toxin-antitoxin system HicA family toxin [Nevskia soli]
MLESSGWRLKKTNGSHRQFRHAEKGIVVTVQVNLVGCARLRTCPLGL